MRILVAVAVLITALASCSRSNRENGRQIVLPSPDPHRVSGEQIVLPNPDVLRTCPSKSPQLWRDLRNGSDEIYPVKFYIDLAKGGCSYGFMVWYDKSVSLEEVRQAINQRYAKWELADFAQADSKMRLWRIESERFVIQLTRVGVEEKDKNIGEPGMTQLIYLPFSSSPFRHIECECR